MPSFNIIYNNFNFFTLSYFDFKLKQLTPKFDLLIYELKVIWNLIFLFSKLSDGNDNLFDEQNFGKDWKFWK